MSGSPNRRPWAAISRVSAIADSVQQRLGRDAAHVQADPAEGGPLINQDDLLTEVGGAERGRVAAGPGAQHQHVGVQIGPDGIRPDYGRGGGHRLNEFLPGLQFGDRVARRNSVADRDPHGRDRPRVGRWDVHRGLVGFQRDQRIFGGRRLAHGDVHLDDRNVGEVADVGDG